MKSLLLLIPLAATLAFGTQPTCTGDRHYDEAGQCCPVVTQPEECQPVLPCPDIICQPVTCTSTCEDGADGDDGRAAPPTIVQVDRCPEQEALERCKVRSNGIVVCPRAKRKANGKPGPRSIWVPESLADKIADRVRY